MDDNTIITGIKDRDDKVVSRFYKTIIPKIRNSLNGGDNNDADDMFRAAYAVVEKKLLVGDYYQENFQGFFMGVVRNLWRTELRKRRGDRLIPTGETIGDAFGEEPDPFWEEQLELMRTLKDREIQRMYGAFQKLSEKQRTVIRIRHFDDPTNYGRTAAETLGMVPPSKYASVMRMEYKRGMKRLRKLLGRKV